MMICSTCVHAGTYHSRLIIQQQNLQPPNSEMARSTQGDRATHRKADERHTRQVLGSSPSAEAEAAAAFRRSIVVTEALSYVTTNVHTREYLEQGEQQQQKKEEMRTSRRMTTIIRTYYSNKYVSDIL